MRRMTVNERMSGREAETWTEEPTIDFYPPPHIYSAQVGYFLTLTEN